MAFIFHKPIQFKRCSLVKIHINLFSLIERESGNGLSKLSFDRIVFSETQLFRITLFLHLRDARIQMSLLFIDSTLTQTYVSMELERKEFYFQQETLLKVSVKSCSLSDFRVQIRYSPTLMFVHLSMIDSWVAKQSVRILSTQQAVTSFWIHNCTFEVSQNIALDLHLGLFGTIVNSRFHVGGVNVISNDQISQYKRNVFFTWNILRVLAECQDFWCPWIYHVPENRITHNYYPQLHIENVSFMKTSMQGKIASSTLKIDCQIVNTVFEATSKMTLEGFIRVQNERESCNFKMVNVHLNASQSAGPCVLANLESHRIEADRTWAICPQAMVPKEMVSKSDREWSWKYHCVPSCFGDTYTLDKGKVILDGSAGFDWKTYTYGEDSLLSRKVIPQCLACPNGAKCRGGSITALPGHWGFVWGGAVSMVRCPAGQCCESNTTCDGIDSCASGRKGTLCGRCEENLTESIISTQCVSNVDCQLSLFISLYITSALCYAIVVLVTPALKDVFVATAKRVASRLSTTFHQKENSEKVSEQPEEDEESEENVTPGVCSEENSDHRNSANEIEETTNVDCATDNVTMKSTHSVNNHQDADTKAEGGGTKYIQILFFFIQDVSLFKVHLMEDSTEGNIILNLLEYSPELLAAHTHLSSQCLLPLTAITKSLLKGTFGFSVMIVIFIIFGVHKGMTRIFASVSKCWDSAKGAYVEAFLHTLLFSFQKTISSLLPLNQCVTVRGDQFLYIQGTTRCHLWWQDLISGFVCMNVLPVFFIISVFPFWVKERKIATQTFLLACFFPLPMVTFYCLKMLCKKGNAKECFVNKFYQTTKTEHVSEDTLKMTEIACPENTGQQPSAEDVANENMDTIEQVPEDGAAGEETANISASNSSQSEICMTAKSDTSLVCEDAVADVLLKHYKLLAIFGVRLTWLGVHKLYRAVLVILSVYVTDHLEKLLSMCFVLIGMSIATALVKPYEDRKANIAAVLSFTANLAIALLNIVKVGLVKFGCETNCSVVRSMLLTFGVFEKALICLPIGGIGLWILVSGMQETLQKIKKRFCAKVDFTTAESDVQP